jgi:Autophagy protein Apg5.
MKRFESWSGDTTACHGKTRRRMIPWNIRVHFTSYPSTLLPLTTGGRDDVEHITFQNYLNSLKQALYIQHQSNKIAKNLNKKSHMILWDGIRNHRWNDECAAAAAGGGTTTNNTTAAFDEVFFSELNGLAVSGNSANNHHSTAILRQVPIRLLVNDEPPFTRPCPFQSDGAKETAATYTLEDILKAWLLNLFDCRFCCCIQGIQVPLNTPVNELWKMLCSPDRFLYISVVTKSIPEDK